MKRPEQKKKTEKRKTQWKTAIYFQAEKRKFWARQRERERERERERAREEGRETETRRKERFSKKKVFFLSLKGRAH